MVKLNKIYTKTGDDGTTGLSDGSRVKKYDLRPSAYGDVDELNSFIGLSINCINKDKQYNFCLLYTSPSPRDATLSRMPSSA